MDIPEINTNEVEVVDGQIRPKRPLVSLDNWNRSRPGRDVSVNKPNGIACPQCGKELVDTDPHIELMSHPPQKQVLCVACHWTGTRKI